MFDTLSNAFPDALPDCPLDPPNDSVASAMAAFMGSCHMHGYEKDSTLKALDRATVTVPEGTL